MLDLSPVQLTPQGVRSAITQLPSEPETAYERFCFWVLVGAPEANEYLPITCERHGFLSRKELVAMMKIHRWNERYADSPYPPLMIQFRSQIQAHLKNHLPSQIRATIGQCLTLVQQRLDAGLDPEPGRNSDSAKTAANLAQVYRTVVEVDRIRQGLASDPGLPGAHHAESEREQYERLTPEERKQFRHLRAIMRGEKKVIDIATALVQGATEARLSPEQSEEETNDSGTDNHGD